MQEVGVNRSGGRWSDDTTGAVGGGRSGRRAVAGATKGWQNQPKQSKNRGGGKVTGSGGLTAVAAFTGGSIGWRQVAGCRQQVAAVSVRGRKQRGCEGFHGQGQGKGWV